MKGNLLKSFVFVLVLGLAISVFALSGTILRQKENKKNTRIIKKEQYIDSSKANTFNITLKNPEIAKKVKKEQYKKLGWEVGKFRSKKEKEYTEILLKEKDEKYRRSIEFDLRYILTKKGNKDGFRPLIEGILDPDTSYNMRLRYISDIGILGDTRAIPILLKFANDKDIIVRELVGNSLYELGEKDIAFQIYETLVKDGIIIPNGLYKFQGDLKAKKMLFRILKYDNNPVMQALALYYLATFGEKDSIINTYKNLKARVDKREIDIHIKKNKIITSYLSWAEKKLGLKNEKK